jgi:hypothetical protein
LVRAARFSARLSHFVSKRPIWLAEAADPVIARSPTTQRIAVKELGGGFADDVASVIKAG